MPERGLDWRRSLQFFPTDDPRRRRKAIALAKPKAASENPEPQSESAYATRERLRGERSRLVAKVARRTNKSHRDIQARINRATRARSVAGATIDQLERGNEMLRGELWR